MSNSNRRQFLKTGAALGIAAGTAPVVHAQDGAERLSQSAYGRRSSYVTSKRISDGGSNCSFGSDCNTLTPLQDLHGIITPSALHFNGSHGAYPPDINPAEHELLIHGLVDRPMKFNMAELQRLPFISRILFIECAANYPLPKDITVQHTHGKTGCSEWTGVPLSLVLERCGVKSGAKWIVAEGADRDFHSKSIPLAKAMDDCLLTYGQNGEPLRPHQGFPLRLMVPGSGGFSHVKWLQRIKIVDQPYLTPSERFRVPWAPKSVITFPSGGQQLHERGYYTISGLAWSGHGAIDRVEVSADGGRNWYQAKLHDPVLPKAHTRFSINWEWTGKEAVLMSRCRDDQGNIQASAEQFARAEGVSVERVQTNDYRAEHQWNLIFPWTVAADGSVRSTWWG